MKSELKVFIEEWTAVDSQVGKDNIKKGKSFEEKCEKDGINLILHSLNLSKKNVKIHMNVKWVNCPGEIDIVILNHSETTVICLAECKSRLFDIVSGYKQSGPNRAVDKTSIQLYNKQLPVPFTIPCFVLTTLPSNNYILGIESKVKIDLNRYTLENTFENIDFNAVYSLLLPKYSKTLSPLAWFNLYSTTHLFVLS